MIARRRAGAPPGELRITYPDGSTKTIALAALETMETLDAYTEMAIRAQVTTGELEIVASRPGRVDHDIDSAPRQPRAAGEGRR